MSDRKCECDRRDFLKLGLKSGLALSFGQLLGLTTLSANAAAPHAKACILLWMQGGPSQIDTFDPKPSTSTGGEFNSIGTSVPGIQISEHLPLTAKQAKEFSIIRSMTSREGNHDRARYFVHTGYVQAGVTQHPSFGSIVAMEMMQKSAQLPAFISINGPAAGAGLLGVNFAPFVVRDPEKLPENISYANFVNRERAENRLQLLEAINQNFGSTHGQEEIMQKDTVYRKAIDLMNSPALTAFDISKEKESTRQRYGKTKFGAGCLMARRLIENGVKFVEVELGGWDTHQDNFNRTRDLMSEMDPAYSALLEDLRNRGLLDSTLVVWMGEFGRTPAINTNGGRDHWPQNWCTVLAGGGIKGGQVIGATNQTGTEIKEHPVSVPDLYATLCNRLGIDDNKYNSSPEGRPLRIVDHGKLITSLI